jgi:predicted PurR-regulated permease PerM
MAFVEPKKRFSVLFLITLLVLLMYCMYLIVQPFSEPIFWSILLAISFQPVFRLIRSRIPNDSGAALLTILLILVVVLTPTIFLVIRGANEVRDLYGQLELQSRQEGGWTIYLSHLVERPVQWITQKTGFAPPDLRAVMLSKLKEVTGASLTRASALFSNIAATIGNALLTVFIMFFLLRGGGGIRRLILAYIPLEPHRMNELLDLAANAIVANLYGMLAVAVLQGTLVGIAFVIIGLPSPVIWGTAASIASLIPIVGSSIVWLPGVAILLFAGSYGKGIFLLLWCAFLVGTVDNIVRPLIVKKGVNLNTLMIFIALMGGVQAFGLIGLFAGPVIFSVAQAVFRILQEERRDWEQRMAEAAPEVSSGTTPPEAQ